MLNILVIWRSRSWRCKWKGLDLRNNVCEYEVNQLTNETIITGKKHFNANCLWRRTPAHPTACPLGQIHQSISWNFLWKKSGNKQKLKGHTSELDLIDFKRVVTMTSLALNAVNQSWINSEWRHWHSMLSIIVE